VTVARRPPAGQDRAATPVGTTLSPLGFAAACGTFLLIGALLAIYGPILGPLSRRFDVALPTAGLVVSAHFCGALVGAVAAMAVIERVPARLAMTASLGLLALGCAGVAAAPSWALLLAAVGVVGVGFGGLDLGLNQLLTHSGRSPARLNLLNAQFGIGAVAGPLLVAVAGEGSWRGLYAAAAGVAVVLGLGMRGLSGRLGAPAAPAAAAGRASRSGWSPLVALFVVAFVLYVGAEVGVGGWMPTHLEQIGYGSAAAATLTSGFWCALAVGRLLVAPVAVRVPARVIVLAAISAASLVLLLALVTPLTPAGYLLTGLAFAPVFPTGLVWLAQLNPGNPRSTSWVLVAALVGGVLFPPVVGAVIERSGATRAPVVLAAVAVGSLAAFLAAARYRPDPAG
jgi:FHS family glucose/mannose:H+ symporter-like MFS transporter